MRLYHLVEKLPQCTETQNVGSVCLKSPVVRHILHFVFVLYILRNFSLLLTQKGPNFFGIFNKIG